MLDLENQLLLWGGAEVLERYAALRVDAEPDAALTPADVYRLIMAMRADVGERGFGLDHDSLEQVLEARK
jgi:hypothetical protein